MKINTAAAIIVFSLPAALASGQDGPAAALQGRHVGGPTTLASLVARNGPPTSHEGKGEAKKKPCGNKFTCTVDDLFPTGIPKRDAGPVN
ncbi:hypothetical protein MCOR07_006676 [Pyricularia oryzae]|uniref:Uncharacterized protein n=1 Tax=Pyricularia grisea TaxID=148305 RepID=A0ABQ8N9G7_PYRGI|nr:hypothetical protein MCOR19_011642 [Pyricularia oryzae]KAI6293444.1 hypothetical protein MCOR33_009123 [Pyricularia grisea]KAI6307167.1 hypothetical protein MCOR29_009799 [Pyricularia oryzae]KAI6314937.1 hypothetical protein MCOR30_009821 [Pyricularia oryzae]KAI6353948.1 hypothetical protein MCOR31_011600 [Pyricularia oryzae]